MDPEMDLTVRPGRVLISILLAWDDDVIFISVGLGVFDSRLLLMIYWKSCMSETHR